MNETNAISCSCGAVTAEVIDNAACVFSAICHCSQCRKSTAAPYFWGNAWLNEQVKVSGETITFTHEINPRHSCKKCGTFVYETLPNLGLTMLPAALLPAPAPPTAHLFVTSKVYMLPNDGLPRYAGMPDPGNELVD